MESNLSFYHFFSIFQDSDCKLHDFDLDVESGLKLKPNSIIRVLWDIKDQTVRELGGTCRLVEKGVLKPNDGYEKFEQLYTNYKKNLETLYEIEGKFNIIIPDKCPEFKEE
jgi:hypothetical protein